MDNNSFKDRFKERKKRCFTSRLGMNLLLLLPPSLCFAVIIFFAGETLCLSLFLTYLILPMFYTVLYRLKYDVTGVGNPSFSYKDGYKDFFTGNMSGVFGALSTFFSTFALVLLFYIILSPVLSPLASAFNLQDSYQEIVNAANNTTLSFNALVNQITEPLCELTQPIVTLVSLILYVPLLYAIFCSIPANLDNHHLATIVLPDIDKNVTAGQARSLSRGSFGKFNQGYRISHSLKQNWPYYLIYTLLYALSTFMMSHVKSDNLSLIALYSFLTPSVSLLYGLYLCYFCLMNDWITMEESQDHIRDSLPKAMQVSIYQTYINPNYIHGEESALRGSFIPAPKGNEYQGNRSEQTYTPYTPSEEKPKENNPETKKEDPVSNVVDLTQNKKDNK